jgi:hypothetical protein
VASAMRVYTKQMHRRFGYFATWLPGVPLRLGDVGIMKRNVFEKRTTLKNLLVDFDPYEDQTPTDLEFSYGSGTDVAFKASGSAVPSGCQSLAEAEAGFIVEFSSQKGFVFRANGVKHNAIADQLALRNAIIKLYKEGKWDKNYVVITDIALAESGTTAIGTSGAGGKIELKATVDPKNIADINAELKLGSSHKIGFKVIAQAEATPIFKARRIKVKSDAIPTIEKSKMLPRGVSTLEFDPFDVLTPAHAKKELRTYLDFEEVAFEEDEEEEDVA